MMQARILVVEDYPSMGAMIARILREAGYDVKSVISGEEARRLCETENFDLAVIDIRLPDVDGWELFADLRRRLPLRAIACTTCSAPDDIARSFSSGFDAHMTKPIEIDNLLDVVAAVVSRGTVEARPAAAG